MALAPSPCMFRVLSNLTTIDFEYDVGAGPVIFTHTVGLGLVTEGVVAGNGAADDLLLALQIDLAGQAPALAASVVVLEPTSWRVLIDVGEVPCMGEQVASVAGAVRRHGIQLCEDVCGDVGESGECDADRRALRPEVAHEGSGLGEAVRERRSGNGQADVQGARS